jgi:ACS family hexuronate transporter-like MFS transporter
MLAALFVPWCLIHWGEAEGWKMAYLLTGGIGFVWLIFWFRLYNPPHKSKQLTKEEFDYIHEDDLALHAAASEDVAVREKVSWWKLFRFPQTWAFFMGKFLTDGIWWFLLFWLPDYLKKQFGMDVHHIMWPTFIVYAVSIFGSTFGGNLPRMMINHGTPVYKARMRSMFIIALFPLFLLLTQYFGDKALFGNYASILAIGVICIGAAAHQAWSANLFTTVSDMFPKKAIGSVTGIGGMAGGLGGVVIQRLAGILNTNYHSHPQTAYLIMFVISALAYILAWAIIKILTRNPSKIPV